MKKTKLASLLLLTGLLTMTSCGSGNEKPNEPGGNSDIVTNVDLEELVIKSPNNTSKIKAGEVLKLSVESKPNGASNEVVWSSSNSLVATVDENGNVKGVSEGLVIITATSKVNSNIMKEIALTVEKADQVVPKDVVITNSETKLAVGSTLQLNAKVSPENSKQKVVWTSSNEKIAKVSSAGLVTALAEGEVTITVKVEENPSITKSITLNVFFDKVVMDEEKWLAVNENTHEEYIALRKDNQVKVSGTVLKKSVPTPEGNYNLYIGNGRYGYYLKNINISLGELKVGSSYVFGGTKGYSQGTHSVQNVEFIKELDKVIPTEVNDITSLASYDEQPLQEYMNSLVKVSKCSFKNRVLFDPTAGGFNVKLDIDGKSLDIRINPSYFTEEQYLAFGEKISNILPGQPLLVKGFMEAFGYGKYHTPQITITSIDDIQLLELNNQEKVQLAIDNIELDTIIRTDVDKINLPKTNSVLTDINYKYETDSELINIETGAVTHGAKDQYATIKVTASNGTDSVSKLVKVYVFALNDDALTENAKLTFDTSDKPNKYNCSLTKSSYKNGQVELEGHKWEMNNALIGCDESDRFEGSFSARVKGDSENNSIILLDPVVANYVEFKAAAYGKKPLGVKIQVSYAVGDSNEFIDVDQIISVDSYKLEVFRFILPVEANTPVKIKISVLQNKGTTTSIDSIRLLADK